MAEEEKLAVAIIILDGEALAWFQWEERHQSILSLGEKKAHLLDRFQHTQEGTLCEQFLSLKQDGSVRNY